MAESYAAMAAKAPEKAPKKAPSIRFTIPRQFTGNVTEEDQMICTEQMTGVFLKVSGPGNRFPVYQTTEGVTAVIQSTGGMSGNIWEKCCKEIEKINPVVAQLLRMYARLIEFIHSPKSVPLQFQRLFKQPSPFQPLPVKERSALLEKFFKECLGLDAQKCDATKQFLLERAKHKLYELDDLQITFSGVKPKLYIAM